MGNLNQEPAQTDSSDSFDDSFEPVIGEFSEEVYEGTNAVSTEKQKLAEKRRHVEQLLEERRLREELGDYDFEFRFEP